MRSLRAQLLLWLIGGLLACSLVTGIGIYTKVSEEAYELFDYQLDQIASSMPSNLPGQPPSAGMEEEPLVQVWDGSGKLLYASRPKSALDRLQRPGYETVHAANGAWRVYAERHGERTVQVALPVSDRDALVRDMTLRALAPFVILIPILSALIWLIVGKVLRPVGRIVESVTARSAAALQPLPLADLPSDIRPLILALNDLLERLGRALDLQREFIANAAHELRTPLTALKLQLDLAERAESPEQRAVAFAKLHERLDRSTRLVRQLLTLAHQERGAEPAADSRADLRQVAESVVADYAPLAEERAMDLGLVAERSIAVAGDAAELKLLVGNLVDNAIRYTPRGGQVDVRIDTEAGNPLLQVVDNGPGIPPEERALVFGRFYRRPSNEASGSGIGLAIVEAVARRCGAKVELREHPDGGLCARVAFRMAPR